MTAPDFVSPIVGYRVWRWDAMGLQSLNGVEWCPGTAFTAVCRTNGCCKAPQAECTCGVYASKTLDHLRHLGYMENRIHGEVNLWGTVVEHADGWRAEFAYPKNLVVPLWIVPLSMSKVELWLTAASAYGCDILVDSETGTVPLWRTRSGVEASGIEMFIRRCNAWYAQQAERRRIKPGDRVAVIGHGIAIVQHADSNYMETALGNRSVLRIERNEVVWCEQYGRWETSAGASIGLTACRV